MVTDDWYAPGLADEGVMMVTGHCGRCGTLISGDADRIPTIRLDTRTLCTIRPDGTDVDPHDRDAPHTTQAILCGGCAGVLQRADTVAKAGGPPARMVDMFPMARLELIDVEARRAMLAARS